jgi:hypothetical protein
MIVSAITTTSHNIGDDFVREGIAHILRSVVDVERIELIHKHSPITAVYGFEGLRDMRISRLLEPALRMLGAKNRIDDADLLVQCGAPVYWCHQDGSHCGNSEWFGPLIRERFIRGRSGRKFLNIAGGSCQRYHSNGDEIDGCECCGSFIRDLFDACDLTILRDELAKSMLNKVARNAEVLPCASIFARDVLGIGSRNDGYIVLNFMEYGGHYTFGQNIDRDEWRREFVKIASVASKIGRVIAACHTRDEQRLVRDIVPGIDTFLVPNDHLEFIRFYAGARFGVVNRVHAAFMMASFGKPVAVIGNDSRALMVNTLNLPSYFVGDVSDLGGEHIVESIAARVDTYRDEVEYIRRSSLERYKTLVAGALQ